MELHSVKNITGIKGKRVMVRMDLDMPLGDDGVLDPGEDSRLVAGLPTIKLLLKKGAHLVIVGHMGRPEGRVVEKLRMRPVVERLVELLEINTGVSKEKLGPFESYMFLYNKQEVHVLENIRFYPGERLKTKTFVQDLSKLADIYINEAFANSHRNHSSISQVPLHLPSHAGINLAKEVATLGKVLKRPARPLTLIIGGVKAETKLKLVEKFIPRADYILLGSAVANNFYRRMGYDIGLSKYDGSLDQYVDRIIARPQYRILDKNPGGMLLDPAVCMHITPALLRSLKKRVMLPVDTVAASLDDVLTEKKDIEIVTKNILHDTKNIIPHHMSMLDIGPITSALYAAIIQRSKTIIWNGPMGFFEKPLFDKGTYEVAKAVAGSRGKGIVGGGDTIAAVESEHVTFKQNVFVSTGGGAMLEFLLDPLLPGIKPLV